MGYVESTRSGTTGIGKTFEDLIGKKEDTLDCPDYLGIEIKTKRSYSKSYITLFSCVPKGESEYEIKRLRDKFGYPDRDFKEFKVLRAVISADHAEIIANKFLFKLVIDYENQKLLLSISDRFFNNIEKTTYWDLALLKEKLERKLQYLALIKAWPNRINGKEYYKYYDIEFYKLKRFKDFLALIEDGTIRVFLNIGINKTKEHIGEIKDYGTGFRIKETDLYKLFERIHV